MRPFSTSSSFGVRDQNARARWVGGIKRLRYLLLPVLFLSLPNRLLCADHPSDPPGASPPFELGPFTTPVAKAIEEVTTSLQGLRSSRFDLPRHRRVSRSNRPLRVITLLGGDRLAGEILKWGQDVTEIRLQSKQVIRIPSVAISRIEHPPGEADLLSDSFEIADVDVQSTGTRVLDATQHADGHSSLKVGSTSTGWGPNLDPAVPIARIEFSFLTEVINRKSPCGEWRFEWHDKNNEVPPLVVRIDGDRKIRTSGLSLPASTPALQTGEGWHTFLVLITSDRLQLIVDDLVLTTITMPVPVIGSLQFHPVDNASGNTLWIDELQIRQSVSVPIPDSVRSEFGDRDRLVTLPGDEIFGRIDHLTESHVVFESLGQLRTLPLAELASLDWSQPIEAVGQCHPLQSGIHAIVELQSFVDRPECPAERWLVTITKFDAHELTALHSLAGELRIRWTDLLRITPLFYGQSSLIDARTFHLGNSIRADFHRHLPDSTEWSGQFDIDRMTTAHPWLSFHLAELEAAGATAPPGSPFLSELRAGQLVTDVRLNQVVIGNLNSQVRFKAPVQRPDRVRLPIPPDLLKLGKNSFQLKQRSLNTQAREFDDCEIGPLRIDFERDLVTELRSFFTHGNLDAAPTSR